MLVRIELQKPEAKSIPSAEVLSVPLKSGAAMASGAAAASGKDAMRFLNSNFMAKRVGRDFRLRFETYSNPHLSAIGDCVFFLRYCEDRDGGQPQTGSVALSVGVLVKPSTSFERRIIEGVRQY